MDRDTSINRVLRDMKMWGLIAEEASDTETKFYLNLLWVAGYEYYRKHEINHNRKKIEQYTLAGIKIAEYSSIEEAAKAYGCRRDAIDCCLNGRTKRTKKGHIWKYADDGKGSD